MAEGSMIDENIKEWDNSCKAARDLTLRSLAFLQDYTHKEESRSCQEVACAVKAD